MTYAALFVLAVVALLPLLLSLRGVNTGRGRREAALALHRAQLQELERDRTDGRISGAEHAAALLEVQRRLLAADALGSGEISARRRLPLIAAMLIIPASAFALYLVGGHPGMPGAPMSARLAAADSGVQSAAMLAGMLRDRLTQPGLSVAQERQGYVLLGNTEDSLGHLAQAAQAWRQAVRLQFDPALAALAAEAQTRVDGGKVSADSHTLFTQALALAPKDAPWRATVEQRLRGAAPAVP